MKEKRTGPLERANHGSRERRHERVAQPVGGVVAVTSGPIDEAG